MKIVKNFIPVVILVLLFPLSNYAGKNLTVVDHFNKLNKDMNLKFINGRWRCTPEPDYGSYKQPVVDIKNGFIRVVYMGGDGSTTTECALFIDSAKNSYIGMTTFYDGIGGDYTVQFNQVVGNSYRDVTGTLLAGIGLHDFCSQNHNPGKVKLFISAVDKMKKGNGMNIAQVGYTLPQYGTVVKAVLNVKDIDAMGIELTDKEKELYRYFRTVAVYKEIHLRWDMKRSRFIVFKKVKK